MASRACLIAGCMTLTIAQAAGLETSDVTARSTSRASVLKALSMEPPGRGRPAPVRESPLARAIGLAAKKGPVDVAVEAYTEVLIQCQKEQSPTLTTALLRSDSQQAHCFRF